VKHGRRLDTRLFLAGMASILIFAVLAGAPANATPLPSTVEGWIYPGSLGGPTCDVPSELTMISAAPISVLKPEYLTVNGRGAVLEETASQLPCNGFSTANLAQVRAAASKVYVTVSAGGAAVGALLSKSTRRVAAEETIETFVTENHIDGVDLDFEPIRWTTAHWSSYMSFVSGLVNALEPSGAGVEVDMEPFTTTPYDAERYAGPVAAGAHLVVMAYDHEYDTACAAISPYSWLEEVVGYALSQVPEPDLTVGLPSYGYHTTTCSKVKHVTSNVAYVTMEHEPGFSTDPATVAARRDPGSGEIRWSQDGVFYDYVDSTSLNAKLSVVEALGITDVSVWSLGGEPWFSGDPG
jgi:spore germination protein YaaH